jgi:hypothetical protein
MELITTIVNLFKNWDFICNKDDIEKYKKIKIELTLKSKFPIKLLVKKRNL